MPRANVYTTVYLSTAVSETRSHVSGTGHTTDVGLACAVTETLSRYAMERTSVALACAVTETVSRAKMSGYMTVWYYSKPATMTDDSSVCGLPLEVQGIMVKMAEVTARRRRGEDVRALEASIEADIRSLSEAGVPGRGRGSRLAPGIEPGVEGAD